MPLDLSDLGDELLGRVIASCRDREPTVVGILAHGSYATGRAHPDSDLDLDLFISGEPTAHYRTWFEDRPGSPLHVSARCDLSIEVWQDEMEEPEDWALGLPLELPHVWLWVSDESLVAAIGEKPVLQKPGSSPEIEDMIDALRKMRRHHRSADQLGVRLEAQAAARFAAPTVAALNPAPAVTTPRAALECLLALSIVPPHWPEDMVAALGLSGAAVEQVASQAERLVTGTLQLAREVNPSVDEQPDIQQYLRDGTLLRMLTET